MTLETSLKLVVNSAARSEELLLEVLLEVLFELRWVQILLT